MASGLPGHRVAARTATLSARIKSSSGMSPASATAEADTPAGTAAPAMPCVRATTKHTLHGAEGPAAVRISTSRDDQVPTDGGPNHPWRPGSAPRRPASEAFGLSRCHRRGCLCHRRLCRRRRRRRGGLSDCHRASDEGPCLLLTHRHGRCCADGDEGARYRCRCQHLTRLCLIDSTVTPPIGLRRSPDRDVLPLNVMDAYASLRPTLKNTEIRPRRN